MNSRNSLPQPQSPDSERNAPQGRNVPLYRRDFLKILGVGGASVALNGIPWNDIKAEEMDPKELLRLKRDALETNREQVQKLLALREATPNQVLDARNAQRLFADLPKFLGCIDEGLYEEFMHKIGVAGLGAGMSADQRNLFGLYMREHPELAKKIKRACWHEHCAARNSDDGAAESGGKELLNALGEPLSKLERAGFSDQAAVKMHRDIHLHPGQGLVVDATQFRCNEQSLGAPLFKVSANGVPKEYVLNEVALTGKIIAGTSGMAEVLTENDPILLFVAAETKGDAVKLEKELKPATKDYPKEPEFIHLVQSA